MTSTPPPVRLRDPQGLTDMLLYRLNRVRAVGGGMKIAELDRLLEGVQKRAGEMLEAGPSLPLADRRHGGSGRRGRADA